LLYFVIIGGYLVGTGGYHIYTNYPKIMAINTARKEADERLKAEINNNSDEEEDDE
jgi:hypothetical protein